MLDSRLPATALCLALACVVHDDADPDESPTDVPADDPEADPESLPAWEFASSGISGGGALYSPSFSPRDHRELYMATDMSGVFHSTDLGAQWRTLDFRELEGGVRSQVRFTSEPDVLYAVDHRDDLHVPVVSRDGGATWQGIADPTDGDVFNLHVDPQDPNHVMVSDWSSLYVSTDGGASFTSVYSTDADSGCLIGGVVYTPGAIYVASPDGLLASTDRTRFDAADPGGISGETIVSFAGAADPDGQVTLYAVTWDSQSAWAGFTGEDMWGYANVYRLRPGVDPQWTAISPSLPNVMLTFAATADRNPEQLYLAGGNGDTAHPVVLRSTDSGDTWTDSFVTRDNQNIQTGWSGAGGDMEWWFGEYALGFAVAPDNPDVVAMTDLGFVHVTDDGGRTWRQAYVNPDDAHPAGSPTPTGRTYRTNGVEQTSSWWMTWIDDGTVFTSLTDITSARSTDDGATWARDRGNNIDHNSVYHTVYDAGRGILYAGSSEVHDLYQSTDLEDDNIDDAGGSLWMSTDAGATFSVMEDFGHPVVWLTMTPNDPDTLYASVVDSVDGGIYVTRDLDNGASATWSQLAAPPRTEGHPFVMHVLDDGTLVASYSGRRAPEFTESSGVFTSSDGGESWSDVSDPGMHYWTKDIVIDPTDETQSTWYVGVFSHWGAPPNDLGGVYRTTDRGANWQRISDLTRVESITVDPDDAGHLYVTTETDGLWESTDAGATFGQVEGYPFRHPTRVFYAPDGDLWVVSLGGGLRVMTP